MKLQRTPLMKQYHEIKLRYKDALLLFRVGDFYETFEEDAVKCSKALNIVLTTRSDTKLAGFPHHALNNYLPKLVRKGFRVAICDQLEDKTKGKVIIKRGITNLVTPGVTFNEQILQAKSNNFLAALHFEKDKSGVAFLDISTGEFLVAEEKNSYIKELLKKFSPSEIIYQRKKKDKFEDFLENKIFSYAMDDWIFQYDNAYEKLTKHFQTHSLKGFGVENFKYATIAAGVIFNYLDHTQNSKIRHISTLRRIDPDKYVWMDDFTIKSLEILASNDLNGRSLLDVLDITSTPMGARLLKRWIIMPIKNLSIIYARYNLVESILRVRENLEMKLTKLLQSLGDIERLTSKVILEKITPRELMNLSNFLDGIERIKKLLSSSNEEKLNLYSNKFPDFKPLNDQIRKTLYSDTPSQLGKGSVIAPGFSRELDELRALVSSGKNKLELICQRERKRTGIPLKISFNNVFGFYIEIRNAYKDKVPKNWIRRQTLVNSERYITEELKNHEIKILGAEDKIFQLESYLFQNLVSCVGKSIIDLQKGSKLVAHLDVIFSFAKNAYNNEYVRPIINNSMNLYIIKGRHPVIEKSLPFGANYVANDLFMNNVSSQILLITGPNMAGKSAFLRQTALIVLMAHIGSFVPAQYVYLGYFDKIFSRVGAFDNISLGESTFMVEMNETASILNNMSKRSLIILDEIGRGTSTKDGFSIAWAVAEYIHQHQKRPKTLFATHFHELHQMANFFKRIKNFNVSVREIDDNVIFLHQLVAGESTKSLGIHVAKMANMPTAVLNRAQELLEKLKSMNMRE